MSQTTCTVVVCGRGRFAHGAYGLCVILDKNQPMAPHGVGHGDIVGGAAVEVDREYGFDRRIRRRGCLHGIAREIHAA